MAAEMVGQVVTEFYHAVATKYLNVTPVQGLGNIVGGQEQQPGNIEGGQEQQPEDRVNDDAIRLQNNIKYFLHFMFLMFYLSAGFGVGYSTPYVFFNPLHQIIAPLICGSIGLVCVVLRLVLGRIKARGDPVSCFGLTRRVAARVFLVFGLFRILSDLVKRRLDRIPAAAAAAIGATIAPSPFPAHLPRYSDYSLRVLIWLAGIYGVYISDIGLGLYGSGETAIAETSMVLFGGFLVTFEYTNGGLNVAAVVVMVLTVLMAIMLYGSQVLDASLLPTTSGLLMRVVRLERVLISRGLHLPPAAAAAAAEAAEAAAEEP